MGRPSSSFGVGGPSWLGHQVDFSRCKSWLEGSWGRVEVELIILMMSVMKTGAAMMVTLRYKAVMFEAMKSPRAIHHRSLTTARILLQNEVGMA